MPIYPYKCPHCDTKKDVNAKITEEHEPPTCDKCNVKMVRDWSQNTTTFTFGTVSRTEVGVNERAAEMAEKRANENIEREKSKYKSRYV